jgi:hydrogenase large subunit
MKKKDIYIEPLTRIEGHLGIHAQADLEKKKYTDAHSYATMFRGFELILKGREPADAIWITQRVCGVCPVPHAIASVECVDMTYQAPPTPFAIAIRNLVVIAEQLYDSSLGCGILEGPDYSEVITSRFNPDILAKAKTTKAEKAEIHGYNTIGEIMQALNPQEGSLWLKCLNASKVGLKMASLLGGKHPHINIFVPGGIAKTVTVSDLESYYSLLAQQIAFSKEFVAVFDDLIDFLLKAGMDSIGVRQTNLLCYGTYEDPDFYNANYKDMSSWAERRKVTPGVVVNGKLLTTDLIEINVGVNEFVNHSYYEETNTLEIEKDALGNSISKEHPWNEETLPLPGKDKDWESKYSWAKAPRWVDWKKRRDGAYYALEAGPIARMWITANAKKVPESTGKSLKFSLPAGNVAGYRVSQEMTFEWKIPKTINALERIRARAYFHAYSAYVAYNMFVKALDLLNKGQAKAWQRYKRPKSGIGVGLTEAMRGAVGHWCVMRKGKIHRYQIITPTAWNASPRDPRNVPGPYEQAIIDTPITEPIGERLDGIDVVRTIRSFDPCLACTVHVYSPSGKEVAVKELEHIH